MTPRALVIAVVLGSSGLGAPQAARSAGDAVRGEALYQRCQACHAPAFDRVGPRHCGLFGRRAGSVPGFAYSPAMKRSAITWDETTLDRFLAAPMKVMPGTTMTYDGVPDQLERVDLIAFLRQLDTRGPAASDDDARVRFCRRVASTDGSPMAMPSHRSKGRPPHLN